MRLNTFLALTCTTLALTACGEQDVVVQSSGNGCLHNADCLLNEACVLGECIEDITQQPPVETVDPCEGDDFRPGLDNGCETEGDGDGDPEVIGDGDGDIEGDGDGAPPDGGEEEPDAGSSTDNGGDGDGDGDGDGLALGDGDGDVGDGDGDTTCSFNGDCGADMECVLGECLPVEEVVVPLCETLPTATSLAQPHALGLDNAYTSGEASDRWLGADESLHICAQDEVFMSLPGVGWQTVHAVAAWESTDDLDLRFWGPTIAGNGAPLSVSNALGFEMGTYTITGQYDVESQVQVSLEDRVGSMSDDGLQADVQIRTGKQCWLDQDCPAGTACLMPYHNPANGSEMEKWYAMQAGACAPPLEPMCDDADSDQGSNNSMSTAKNGTPSNGQAKSCQFDEDWYDLNPSSDGHWSVTFTNKGPSRATYSVLLMDDYGLVVGDRGFIDVPPNQPQQAITVRYMYSGFGLRARVVKLDAGEGAYDLDLNIQSASCNSNNTCANDSSAGAFYRTQCVAGTCDPDTSPDSFLPVTCPLNANNPECELEVPAL